jgi:hypothetical protein
MKQTKTTKTWAIRPEVALIDLLNGLAKKYGRETGNQVAVEILNEFHEDWATLQDARAHAKEQRLAQLREMREKMTSVELSPLRKKGER